VYIFAETIQHAKMKNQTFDISKLQPHPNNPRTISEEEEALLDKSISEDPEILTVRPIAYDSATGWVWAGNQRLKSLLRLGYSEIPKEWVKDIAGWSEEKKLALMFKDNKQSGEWDWDIIESEFEMVDLEGWGIVEFVSAEKEEYPDDTFEADYDLLNDDEIEKQANKLGAGVKKAILIEFSLEDYPKAYELLGFFRERGADVGRMILLYLENEKEKL
jgi:hypothetical protein